MKLVTVVAGSRRGKILSEDGDNTSSDGKLMTSCVVEEQE